MQEQKYLTTILTLCPLIILRLSPCYAFFSRQLALRALNERTKNQASQLKQDVVIPIPPVSSNI